MQSFEAESCVWCSRVLDPTNSLELAYRACAGCLVPLPAE
jgi:hypothetical protein